MKTFIFSAVLFLIGCQYPAGVDESTSQSSELLSWKQGTIEYVDLEGGFFAIRAAGGKVYDPLNLPEEFKKSGLSVQFKGIERHDLASVHMVGILIEISDIKNITR